MNTGIRVTNADGIAATTVRRGDAVLNTQAQAVVNGYLSASPKLAFGVLIATTCQKYLFLHRGEVRKNGIAAP